MLQLARAGSGHLKYFEVGEGQLLVAVLSIVVGDAASGWSLLSSELRSWLRAVCLFSGILSSPSHTFDCFKYFGSGSFPSMSSLFTSLLMDAPRATRKTVEKSWLYETPFAMNAQIPMSAAIVAKRMAIP